MLGGRQEADLSEAVVQVEACSDIQAEQQVGAGDFHRPERAAHQFAEQAGAVHQQVQGEERVSAFGYHAERQPGAHQEVHVVLFRFEYTKEVLNEMASNIESKKSTN